MHIEPISWLINFIKKNCYVLIVLYDVVIWQAYCLNTGVFIVSYNFKDLPSKSPSKVFRVSTDSILGIYWITFENNYTGI